MRRNSAGSSSEESPCGIVPRPHNGRWRVSSLRLLRKFTRGPTPILDMAPTQRQRMTTSNAQNGHRDHLRIK